MTPISNFYVPDDIVKNLLFLTIDDVSHLGKYRTVCKDFKRITDNKEFLQRLLVKMKGEHFVDSIYSNDPKKFLAFDSEAIRVFKTLQQTTEITNQEQKDLYIHLSSIALKDLNLGTIYLHRKCKCHGNGFLVFKCSPAQIENLKNVDFEKRDEWQACLSNIADSIVNFEQSNEMQSMYLHLSGSFLPEKAKAAFDNPDENIKKMIAYFGITNTSLVQSEIPEHIFKIIKKTHRIQDACPPTKIVINSKYRISYSAMITALCTRQEFILYLKRNLYRDIVKNLAFEKLENGSTSFLLSMDMRRSLQFLFEENDVRLTELINRENFNSEDNSGNDQCFNTVFKIMMCLLFPDILQNLFNQLSHASKLFIINSWMVKIYAAVKEGVNYLQDHQMHKIMTDRLKNRDSGLKVYIEQSMGKVEPEEIVSLPWKAWFPEVWPNKPQDQAKAIQDDNSASSDKG